MPGSLNPIAIFLIDLVVNLLHDRTSLTASLAICSMTAFYAGSIKDFKHPGRHTEG